MKFGSKTFVALIAAGVMSVPMVASASVKANNADVEKIVITYQVDDLSTVVGRAALEREIRGAAIEVCGEVDYGKVRSLKALSDNRSCVSGAVSRAMSELGSGTLQITAR